MLTEHYLERSEEQILLRIAVNDVAVIDILTDANLLGLCRSLMRNPDQRGLQETRIGTFGPFDVTLSLLKDGMLVALLIDGPDLADRFRGSQSAGVYLTREELLTVLDDERSL